MNSIQYKDYLQHFGVKGMKWGVRRYENPDGTLTAAGKARYGHYETSIANAKNDTARATAEAKLRSSVRTGAQNDTRSMSTIAREGSSMSNQMSNIARTQGNAKIRKAKAAIDLSEMSDQDLQKAINRMNMEQNYKRLATADIASGHEHVNEILSTVGAGLAVTASALTIALSIQQLRHG